MSDNVDELEDRNQTLLLIELSLAAVTVAEDVLVHNCLWLVYRRDWMHVGDLEVVVDHDSTVGLVNAASHITMQVGSWS